jgi:peptidoglycan/LPS O-acetylase OafA/YrhL
MGLLRVLLALAVLLQHTGALFGYRPIGGQLAVQCFFIISGFYMGLVLTERYDRPALNRAFWTNRALRIYGVYFFFLALHLGVFALLELRGAPSPLAIYATDAIPRGERAGLALLNLTVVGQEWPLWLQVRHGGLAWTAQFLADGRNEVFHYMAIPMAWSLSLELMFYAVAPFIVRRPAWQITLLALASLAARFAAAQAGYASDPWTARFFPFELALFLAGVLAYKAYAAHVRAWNRPVARCAALVVPLAILAWPLYRGTWPDMMFFSPPRLALLAIVASGLPAIHAWRGQSRRDRAIGELSFPLYLGHLLIFGLLGAIPLLRTNPSLWTLTTIAVSLWLSWLVVQTLDARIEAFRRRLAERAGAGQTNRGDNAAGFA